MVTGVVKGELVCLRQQRRTALTVQLDELNAYCLYVIASYLKVNLVNFTRNFFRAPKVCSSVARRISL